MMPIAFYRPQGPIADWKTLYEAIAKVMKCCTTGWDGRVNVAAWTNSLPALRQCTGFVSDDPLIVCHGWLREANLHHQKLLELLTDRGPWRCALFYSDGLTSISLRRRRPPDYLVLVEIERPTDLRVVKELLAKAEAFLRMVATGPIRSEATSFHGTLKANVSLIPPPAIELLLRERTGLRAGNCDLILPAAQLDRAEEIIAFFTDSWEEAGIETRPYRFMLEPRDLPDEPNCQYGQAGHLLASDAVKGVEVLVVQTRAFSWRTPDGPQASQDVGYNSVRMQVKHRLALQVAVAINEAEPRGFKRKLLAAIEECCGLRLVKQTIPG